MDDRKKPEDTAGELNQYITHTLAICDLSSPSVSNMADADDYRSSLTRNFVRIGELARMNGTILARHYYPQIYAAPPLGSEAVERLRLFSGALIKASELSYLDVPLVWQQAERLLREADISGSERDRILALDGMVTVSYAMITVTQRLYPVDTVCLKYRKEGLLAGERLLSYLDHDTFRKLDDTCKELVLINARYIRVVSEIAGVSFSKEVNDTNLKRMLDALSFADDPFYREQLPSYDWDYHIFRTLEYIATLTELNNENKYDAGSLKIINDYTKRLAAIYRSDEERYRRIHNSNMLETCLCRNAFLCGETDLVTYKKELERIYKKNRSASSGGANLAVLFAPLEYMLVLDRDHLSREDIMFLSDFYSHAVRVMHQTPKKNALMFLLSSVALLLANFIDVPGVMDFETMCLSMIAAIHPPSYIHMCSVADFSVCLAGHLFRRRPELFQDVPELARITDIAEKEKALTDYVYHAALCHDFGKLMIAETILTYGRSLLDNEFSLVRSHPGIGAYLMRKHACTASYADIAHGHHKWYNNRGGYPDDFDMDASLYRTVIAVISCADCLDAATDAVGRSYKEDKTLDRFLSELHEGSGTRYAPYLAELLADPQVRAEIELLLAKGRDENYRKTFHMLKKHETDWQ